MGRIRYLWALALLFLLAGCGARTDPDAQLSFAPEQSDRLVVSTPHKEEVWRPVVQEF